MAQFIEVTDRIGCTQLLNLDLVENIYDDGKGAVFVFNGEGSIGIRGTYDEIKAKIGITGLKESFPGEFKGNLPGMGPGEA